MIEIAQKEMQKFRWPITRTFVLDKGVIKYIFTCWLIIFFLLHRKQIQDLNWQRKNDQLAGGAKLRELESKYVVWRIIYHHEGVIFSCCNICFCPYTAGCLWSVRTLRLSAPSYSWRTKWRSSGSSRGMRTRRTSDRTSRASLTLGELIYKLIRPLVRKMSSCFINCNLRSNRHLYSLETS